MCYGDFEGWFEIEELGVRIRFLPGDILLIRGSALHHKAGKWTGNGRFVIVPFCDGRLFRAQNIRRPVSLPPIYGSSYKKTRTKYPYLQL
jgi:hypothetical protein